MQLASDLQNFHSGDHNGGPKVGEWLAKLNLKFRFDGENTVVDYARHSGPLRIQRPFYPEGKKVCQVILLHPPGGVAAGDILDINIKVSRAARVQITTPGATKWYKCIDKGSKQKISFHVEAEAKFEWMPQDNIVFNGANVTSIQSIFLEKGSSFLFWDVMDLGVRGEERSFSSGSFKSLVDIYIGGQLLFVERTFLEGQFLEQYPSANLRGYRQVGLLIAVGNTPIDLTIWEKVKNCSSTEEFGGVSKLSESSLIARWIGNSAEEGRNWLFKVWQIIRPWYFGSEAVTPRIWKT